MIIVWKALTYWAAFSEPPYDSARTKNRPTSKSWYPEPVQVLKDNTYTVHWRHLWFSQLLRTASHVTDDWAGWSVIMKGGFQVKGWISNRSLGNEITEQRKLKMKLLQDTTQEKILGTVWNHAKDVLLVNVTHPKPLLKPKEQYWARLLESLIQLDLQQPF